MKPNRDIYQGTLAIYYCSSYQSIRDINKYPNRLFDFLSMDKGEMLFHFFTDSIKTENEGIP